MSSTVYIVTEEGKDGHRLIEARNVAQAVRHVAKCFSATPASPKDVARLYALGVRLERANGAADVPQD